ncbi:thiamine phosphate synthase [Brassicibacter mesophilus]|uniref:thiamine phosphate synthase n=1 Tax=Brassicibacter mesophilus TaxID=745119 RepID=UPI003D1F2A18
MINKSDIDYALYLVTDRNILGNKDLYISIEQAIQGGVSLIQLREKNTTTREFYDLALKVKKITDKYNTPLIINDRLDIALAIDADGLHIGPDDIPINVARKLLGPDKILGASTSSLNEALEAQSQGADYLGVGAMFPTKTKKDTESVNLNELEQIKSSVRIPVVGIGGINETNAKKIINTGADGIAVVSAILGKNDICLAAKNLHSLISK